MGSENRRNIKILAGIGLIFILSLVSYSYTGNYIGAQGGPPLCNDGSEIIDPEFGDEISGEKDVVVALDPAADTPGATVEVRVGPTIAGIAVYDNSEEEWILPDWDSSFSPDGNTNLRAYITPEGSTSACRTDSIQISINNGTGSGGGLDGDLKIQIMPGQDFSGPVGQSIPFSVMAILDDNGSQVDVTQDTSFSWETSIGSVVPAFGEVATLDTGNTPGDGELEVTGIYEDQEDTDSIDIMVFAAGTTPPPPPDPETEDSEDTNQESESSTEVEIPDPNVVDYVLARCLQSQLGDDEYDALLEGEDRLSFRQFREVRENCFEERRYVVPARLAPVDPTTVQALEERQSLEISDIKGVEITDGGFDGNGLVLSGVAEPNAEVLIYVFSDPLVLSTVADANGNWTYTLEDPLEPGDHEAYVVVNSGNSDDSFVRSGVFTFAVASTDPTGNNPNGFSLTLAGSSNETTRYYVIGAAIIVLVASFILTRYLWLKPNTTTGDKTTSQPTVDSTPNEALDTTNSDVKPEPETIAPESEPQVGSSDEEPKV